VDGAVVGNYRLIRKLGVGGMGAVYLGQHLLLGRRAAVKVLHEALSARSDVVNRFFNEARAVTSINDPGIVQVFDFGVHADGGAFIVMEYLEGEPLDRRLARVGRLPVTEAMRLCRQLASSLAAAHAQRIVHRDLKPANIFLVRDGEVASGERSKILDFGIAKLSDDHPGKLKTNTGVLMGTPVYMSPEQCRGLAEVDHRADIYSLGCVVFQLLTGRPPFEGEAPGDIISSHIREPAPTPSTRAPDVPPEVDALVLRCLAKAPADRYQTMNEVAAATERAVQHVPAGAPSQQQPTPKVPGSVSSGPTTLGESSGEFAATPRFRRLGLWIAAGLVAGATTAGIAVLAAGGSRSVPAMAVDASVQLAEPAAPSSTAAESAAMKPVEPAEEHPMAQATEDKLASGPKTDSGSAAPTKTRADRSHRKSKPVSEADGQGTKAAGTRQSSKTAIDPRPGSSGKPGPESSAGAEHAPSSPDRCHKAAFAPVYNAAVPSRDAITRALSTLRECHEAGAINDADFKETQDALIARFVAKP